MTNLDKVIQKDAKYCSNGHKINLYLKTYRLMKPLLAPASQTGLLEDELEEQTGFYYAKIDVKFCPICGIEVVK